MRNGQTSFFCRAKAKDGPCLKITRAYRIGLSFAQSDSSARLHSLLFLEDLALVCAEWGRGTAVSLDQYRQDRHIDRTS